MTSSSSATQTRLLHVGIGGFGRSWASDVVPSVPGVEPVGYVDLVPEHLGFVTESGLAPASRCFGSLEEALAAVDADAALVTTNLPGHVPVATRALDAGLDVLVEKPFAPTVAQAAELVGLAAAQDRILMVSQNYRFFPAVRAVQALVQRGDLGELRSIDVDFRKGVRQGPLSTRRLPLAEPLLSDMAIHHFDLLRAVTGRDPTGVFCRSWQPEGYPYAGPPAATAVIDLDGVAGGLTASYRGSWISPGPPTTWAGDWSMAFDHAEVVWTSRGGDFDDLAGADAVSIRWDDGRVEAPPLPRLAHIDRAGSLAEFVAARAQRRHPESSGAANLPSLALSEAAIESARTRMPVSLDLA